MMGESCLALDVISILEPSLISQAQPDPNRVVAAAPNFSLKAANPPKTLLIAASRFPTGSPPAFGAIIVQNSEWLLWPPPLLRTAVRIFSGTIAQLLASNSPIDLFARSGADSSALFRFVT